MALNRGRNWVPSRSAQPKLVVPSRAPRGFWHIGWRAPGRRRLRALALVSQGGDGGKSMRVTKRTAASLLLRG